MAKYVHRLLSVTISAILPPMAQFDDWLPMGEVIQRTGMSERTIYRHVTEGKIRQAQRPIPGRKPLSVFNPDDVAAMAAFGTTPRNLEILPPLTQLAESLRKTAEFQRASPAQIEAPKIDPADDLATAEWRNVTHWPLYLGEEEARAYSGLGIGYLRTAVAWKRIGPRGSLVCKRADLDGL